MTLHPWRTCLKDRTLWVFWVEIHCYYQTEDLQGKQAFTYVADEKTNLSNLVGKGICPELTEAHVGSGQNVCGLSNAEAEIPILRWWPLEVGLWEVIGSRGWGPRKRDQCLYKRNPERSLVLGLDFPVSRTVGTKCSFVFCHSSLMVPRQFALCSSNRISKNLPWTVKQDKHKVIHCVFFFFFNRKILERTYIPIYWVNEEDPQQSTMQLETRS